MAVDLPSVMELLGRYGYAIIFLAALAEAFPLVSLFVPGGAIVALAGAAAALGVLDIWWIIALCIPGGILGDAAGFYLGRRYGRGFIEKHGPKLRIGPAHLRRTDELFERYGAFALVVFRFSFLTRPVGPMLAGMSRMGNGWFWIWNVVGAVAWAFAYALLGYFFGVAFLEVEGYVGRILAWTAVGVVGVYVLYRVLRRYAARFTRADFYVALVAVVSGAAFGVLTDRVARQGLENRLDAAAHLYHAALLPAAPAWRAMELLGSFEVVGAAALGLLVYLLARRLRREAALVGFGIGGAVIATSVLRAVMEDVLPPPYSGGWPSAHAAVPLVAVGVVTYVAWLRARGRRRAPAVVAVVGGAFCAAAALARLGQGVEQPSSVAAGLAFGAWWLSLVILLVEFALKRGPRPSSP